MIKSGNTILNSEPDILAMIAVATTQISPLSQPILNLTHVTQRLSLLWSKQAEKVLKNLLEKVGVAPSDLMSRQSVLWGD